MTVRSLAARSGWLAPLTAFLLSAAGCSSSDSKPHAGLVITPSTLSTSEGGAAVTFTVALASAPQSTVNVYLSVGDSTEGLIREPGGFATSYAVLYFTSADWNVPQTIEVVPQQDTLSDGNQTWTLTASVVTADSVYAQVPERDISVTNADDDIPGVTVSKTSASTTEGATTDTFTVRLNTLPTATVTIPVTATDSTEGLVRGGDSPSTSQPSVTLTFTTANWSTPQTVTIYGQDDQVDDGNQTYAVTVGRPAGAAEYAALAQQTVSVTNIDDDTAGITVLAGANPLVTSENGTTAEFTVRLNTQPTADVTVAVTSGDAAEGLLSSGAENLQQTVHLVFTSADWATPKTVVVTGQDEAGAPVPSDNVAYDVTVGPATGDAAYAALATHAVPVVNVDNDTAAVIVPAVATGLQTSETGASNTATFTVVLNRVPTTDVVVPVTVSDVSEGLVKGGSSPTIPASTINLTFTPADFQTPQTVTVIGQVDNVVDGNQTYQVTIGVPTGDAAYGGVAAQAIAVTNSDADSPGFTKSVASLSVNEGATSTFTVVLNRAPTADVVIPVTAGNPLEGKISGGSAGSTFVSTLDLTFTPANWQTAQTVTVQGQTDQVDDGNQTWTITVGPTESPGNPYDAVAAQTISATTVDVDVAGVTVTPQTGLVVSESGTTADFTVALATRPLATVTVPVSVTDSSETLVSAGGAATNFLELTFTPDAWGAQTVTVHGTEDALADGSVAWTVSAGPTSSGDPKYQGIAAKTVSGITLDNDATNQGTIATPIDITGLLPYPSQVGSGSSYYMETGLAAGTTAVRLTGVAGDVTLTVFGSSNFSSQQLCQSANTGAAADEVCIATVPASGTIYIQVSAAAGTTGAVFTIGGLPAPPTAESEPNDSIATADGPVAMDALITGSITTAYTYDYYAIANMTAAALSVRMETYTGSVGACTGDTTLELFDASGYSLRYDDESGVNSCSLITYTIPANTTYYLKVAAWSSYTVPSYLLQVDFP